MVDREKTALGIREMLMRDTWRDIDANRPRYQHILNDALALLKEQEKEGKWERQYSRPGVYANLFWWCSYCKMPTQYQDAGIFYEYCPHCGAKMTEGR